VILALLVLLQGTGRMYWPVSVAALASGSVKHTHVAVSGTVTLVHREVDGDLHFRLSTGTVFIVAECIPSLPCRVPQVGEQVTVRGIARHDGEHGWWEVHPVEEGP